MKIKVLLLVIIIIISISCSSPIEKKYKDLYNQSLTTISGTPGDLDNNSSVSGAITLNLEFPLLSNNEVKGVYIWIENTNGDYINTIEQYNSRISVPGAPIRYSNDLCADWKLASGERRDKVVDGISSASLYEVVREYESATWNCLDSTGSPIASGEYIVQVEITYDSGDSQRVYPSRATGTITLGSEDSSTELVYDASDSGGNRVTSVTANFTNSAE